MRIETEEDLIREITYYRLRAHEEMARQCFCYVAGNAVDHWLRENGLRPCPGWDPEDTP